MKKPNIATPIVLLILAIFIELDWYSFTTFQLNALNIGAFCFTLSCINLGSHTNKTANAISKGIYIILNFIGWVFIALTFMTTGFKYYLTVYNIINNFVDTNALLLLGMGITLISFVVSSDYYSNGELKNEKVLTKYQKENGKLVEKIKQLEMENQNLYDEIKDGDKKMQQMLGQIKKERD